DLYEAQHIGVELERAIQVGHLQPDQANPGVGMNRRVLWWGGVTGHVITSFLLWPAGREHSAAGLPKREIVLRRVEQPGARVAEVALERQRAGQAETAGHPQRLLRGRAGGVRAEVLGG